MRHPRRAPTCPTCGNYNRYRTHRSRSGHWRVRQDTFRRLYENRGSLRVRSRICSDPWHNIVHDATGLRAFVYGRPTPKSSAPAETTTTTNLHFPKDHSLRRQAKARKHRTAQSKARR